MTHEAMEPGGTDARTVFGCTCPPEQIGPEFAADVYCPVHGLRALEADMSEWVEVHRDGLSAAAPTREEAEAMIDRMQARRG